MINKLISILTLATLITGCSTSKNESYLIEPNIVTIKKDIAIGNFLKVITKNGNNVWFKDTAPTQEELDKIDRYIDWGRERGFTLDSSKVFIYLINCVDTGKYGYQYYDNCSSVGYSAGEFINQAAPSYCHIIICRQILTNICHEVTHYIIPNDPNHKDIQWKQWGVW